MHGGDADEFIDYMNDGEASVRHRSFVYHYESEDAEDVLNHLTEDILWDGKSFYELEKALTWIDW